jgi:hypothetical protein
MYDLVVERGRPACRTRTLRLLTWTFGLLRFGGELRPPSRGFAVHRNCSSPVEFGFSGYLRVGGGIRRLQMKRFFCPEEHVGRR